MVDGAFASIKIIMPNLRVEGNPSRIKKVHVCKNSTYSMGNLLLNDKPAEEQNEQ